MSSQSTIQAEVVDAKPGLRRAIKFSLELLTHSDRTKYWVAVGVQMALALLDLVGVLLVGVVGALSVASISTEAPLPDNAQQVLDKMGLAATPLLTLAVYAALAAAAFLILKSLLAMYLVRRVLRFLAGRQAQVASRLTGELFARPLTFVLQRSSQETAYALMTGTTAATVELLGGLALALGDVALLVLLTGALLVIDPIVTLAAIAFFMLIALILQRVLGSLARRAGVISRDRVVEGMATVQEAVSAYREITVGNRRSLYRDRVSETMWDAAGAQADSQYVAQVPKYVFETALVIGALALVGAQMREGDPSAAVGTMALFLAAGARVMPSLLRLQVALINMRNAEGRAVPTYRLNADLGRTTLAHSDFDGSALERDVRNGHRGFEPRVEIRQVSYTYPGAERPAVVGADVSAEPGTSMALVGSTGAGKSTLADLLIGVIRPDSGLVTVGGCSPSEAVVRWPGAVAYVPQAVTMVEGDVRHNVALGIPRELIDDVQVWEALSRARLADFLRESRDGLDTVVGEHGVRLSGGQRQRLGLARALYTRPLLLVLDEATSALDAETESAITEMLSELAGTVTTVTIAHRLATVRAADLLLFMEEGRIAAQGTFDEVRKAHPGFDRQARLLGL